MSLVIYFHSRDSGELGSGIWSTIAAIGGAIAGPTAQQAGLPNWASTAIGAGGQILSGLLSQPPQNNCLTGRVSGDEAMTRCIAYIMSQLDQLLTSVGQYPPEQILAAATQLAGAISDDAYFNQSIGGNSRTVREAAKTRAAEKLQAIRNAIAALSPPPPPSPQTAMTAPTVIDPATGQPVPAAAAGATIGGFPLSTVLIFGAIGLGLVLILD